MVLIVLLSIATSATAADAPIAPPHIVVLLADDLGWGDARCYNPDSKIPTPNLDRLASQGVRFTDAHTPSSVCTPTRYGLLTGRYCWRTSLKEGVLWGHSPALIEPGRMTIASLLKAHGYATHGVGKWHLGLGDDEQTDYSKTLHPAPTDYGFDSYFGIPASLDMDPYLYVVDDRAEAQPTETIEKSEHRRRDGGGYWRGGAIAPGFRHIDVLPRITERAVSVIRQHEEQSRAVSARSGATRPGSIQPLFLYFALTAPHTPWMPTDEFRGKSQAGHYGDFVAQVDDAIGQVLRALDETGLAENALVIVTSDNGSHWPVSDIEKFDHRANGPWRGQKADIWEGGHRVPFIVRWPGKIKAGSTSDQTICLTDLPATCAAIVGAELPQNAGEDSYDILPALLGTDEGRPIREATVHHSLHGTFAIRQGDWKLVLGLGSGGFTQPRVIEPKPGEPAGQLYNLAADPAEERNVYAEHPEIVARLRQLLENYKTRGRSRANDE
ncbi:MAG: sulfatase family protein [Planctomycetaceae bacterium]